MLCTCCLTSLQPKRCLLAYYSMYNTFFMNLPVPSFVFHSSLLTAKSVKFGGCPWWLPLHDGKFSVFFILATLIMQLLFKYFLICMGWTQTQLATKCNGYFAFQMIIDIMGCVMPYAVDVVYVGSLVIIIISKKS